MTSNRGLGSVEQASEELWLRHARRAVTVLLVDDDDLVRHLLGTLLTLAGYAVMQAANGQDAIQQAATVDVGMLVTDFQMPEMNGFELARRITTDRPGLPVLMISGALTELLPIEELRLRHWGFLAKPVDRNRLIHTIDSGCLVCAFQTRHLSRDATNVREEQQNIF
jgi:DNA-binding NtrC family response regulator